MSAFLDPSLPNELPDPEAALVLCRMMVEAFLMTMPRRAGAAYLQALARVLTDREELAAIVPIRRTESGASAARAEREALAALRQMLPIWVSRLPPD